VNYGKMQTYCKGESADFYSLRPMYVQVAILRQETTDTLLKELQTLAVKDKRHLNVCLMETETLYAFSQWSMREDFNPSGTS
jgi:hypothetical protein